VNDTREEGTSQKMTIIKDIMMIIIRGLELQ